MGELTAARRDASAYANPAGHGRNPTPTKMHAIISRKDGSRGPACGIWSHDETTEEPASGLLESEKCAKPGCRSEFAKANDA
ncbi:hypothetical protein QE400_000051 [Xanthomonas sacchari]|nr:hypothetical protein [Xanthomonas sacchari]